MVAKERKKISDDEEQIAEEREADPGVVVVVIPDHRVRRLQHLLSDLVKIAGRGVHHEAQPPGSAMRHVGAEERAGPRDGGRSGAACE